MATLNHARDLETGSRKDVVIKKLRRELQKQSATIERERAIVKQYEECFTPGQNYYIRTGKRPTKWLDEDISWSMSIYMASPKAYKLIKPKYKLPGVSTLRERCTRIILQPEIVKPTTSGDQFHYIGEGFVYAETTLNADAIRVLHNVQKCSDLKYAPKLTDVPRKYHWPHSYCQIKWPLGFSIYGIIRT